MRAVTWQGRRKVSVDNVPDPAIKEPNDAIIRVTSTEHLRIRSASVRSARRIHEPGRHPRPRGDGRRRGGRPRSRQPQRRRPGRDPVQHLLRHCFMCDHGLQSQCETTQNRDQGTGAALFGYSKLYGEVAGGQAEYLRVPQAQYTHIKVPDDGARRTLRLSLRRAAHRVAGRRVRRCARRRHAAWCWGSGRSGHGVPHRVAPQGVDGSSASTW